MNEIGMPMSSDWIIEPMDESMKNIDYKLEKDHKQKEEHKVKEHHHVHHHYYHFMPYNYK